jgi:chemotaxis protein methyltransferase CheR
MTWTQLPRSIEHDPAFALLKHTIIDATGLAYYADKDVELATQIARRLTALRIDDCQQYLDWLTQGPSGTAELDSLAASLTIGETFFFRHQEFFDALRGHVIPRLINQNRRRPRLRIWSAGCAIGAEPYSVSILLRREFATELADWDVSILGTDINRKFLAQAERGEFGDWALRSVPDELRASCFVRSGQTWTIRDAYRRDMTFQYHNLVQHPFFAFPDEQSEFDLILCRNVMIYFEPTVVRRLVNQFHDTLGQGGWFVVGPAEPSVGLFRAFETVNLPGVVLYRKPGNHSELPTADTAAANESVPLSRPSCSTELTTRATQVAPPNRRKPLAARGCRTPTPSRTTLADVRLRLNRGQLDAAEECCKALLTTERLNPSLHFYHALVAVHQGRYEDSERSFRRAIYLDRELVLAHYHLGLVLRRNRQLSKAERSFRNVLALLGRRPSDEVFADSDGLTVSALRQLTEMQLEVLSRT